MVCGEGGRSLTNGTPEACGRVHCACGEHKTYDLIRALREAGCARGACALLPKDVRICDAWHLYSAGEEYSSHCVGEKKKKVVCPDRKGALVGPSGGWRHAAAVFENYSQTDSVLQQPARRPAGSRAGAACRDRPVTTECQPG